MDLREQEKLLDLKIERLKKLYEEKRLPRKVYRRAASYLLFESVSLTVKRSLLKYIEADYNEYKDELTVFQKLYSLLEHYELYAAFALLYGWISKIDVEARILSRVREIEELVNSYNQKHKFNLKFSERDVLWRALLFSKSLFLRLLFKKEVDKEWLKSLTERKPRTKKQIYRAVKKAIKELPRSARAKLLEELLSIDQAPKI